MSDGTFISDTLESIIVGMAESLRDAQEELNGAAPLDAFGRPALQYRIPHLDFEVGFRLVTETKSTGGMRLIFAPVSNTDASREVTSTISGRFVAVPAGEGLPLPVLAARIEGSGNERSLVVTAANTAGERLSGAEIELNIDQDASAALSTAAGVPNLRPRSLVGFGSAVLVTGADGRAETTVSFGADLPRAAVVVITAELGSETIRITTGKDI